MGRATAYTCVYNVLCACRLTKREKKDAEYKETLFKLAKEHEKVAMF